MLKYLITGGAGFIGSHLVEKLVGLEKKVLVYDNLSFGKLKNIQEFMSDIKFVKGDLKNSGLLEQTIRGFLPDIIIHLAALHFIPYCNAHPKETVEVNVDGTYVLLDICSKYKPKKVLVASSAAVYAPSDAPHCETDKIWPFDIYGATKNCTEILAQLFTQQTSIPVVGCRIFNAYGPKETNDHVIPHIIKQLKQRKMRIQLGNVSPKRDYIYVKDIADALFEISLTNTLGYEVFNIGTSKEYSVRELISKMSSILGRDIKIHSVTKFKRKIDRQHLCPDISKIKNKIGWSPKYDIVKGLSSLIDFELNKNAHFKTKTIVRTC